MATKTSSSSSDVYLDLLREFRLRPIRDDAAHRRAVEMLDRLSDRGSDCTPDEEDYRKVLSLLVEQYEDSIYEHPEISGAEMLRFLMEERGLTQTKLSAETGLPLTTISEILSGKRGITPKVRTKLCAYFGAGPAVFL